MFKFTKGRCFAYGIVIGLVLTAGIGWLCRSSLIWVAFFADHSTFTIGLEAIADKDSSGLAEFGNKTANPIWSGKKNWITMTGMGPPVLMLRGPHRLDINTEEALDHFLTGFQGNLSQSVDRINDKSVQTYPVTGTDPADSKDDRDPGNQARPGDQARATLVITYTRGGRNGRLLLLLDQKPALATLILTEYREADSSNPPADQGQPLAE